MSGAAGESARYCVVAFTGHRKLEDPRRIGATILAELRALQTNAPDGLAALCSIASGGDTLFAQQALALALPLVILLPFPREEFAKDFAPAEWEAAEECLSQASSVQVLSPAGRRPEAYYEVGIRTVRECGILLAAWNGEPSRGKGGTAEIVACAREQGKPLVWIHSTSGEVTRERLGEKPFPGRTLKELQQIYPSATS